LKRVAWHAFIHLPLTATWKQSLAAGTLQVRSRSRLGFIERRRHMGRGLLLWLIGIPLPIILLIWLFGGLS